MSTAELKAYDFIKREFNLSDEKAMKFIEVIEELQDKKIDKSLLEFKSVFKDDFHQIDLKLSKIDTRFAETDIKIEQTKAEILKWFIGCFITLALMILGLFVTILLK